jgi:hypothetical protein
MRALPPLTAMALLAAALTGCARHRTPPPAPVTLTAPPTLKQTPLYTPDLAPAVPSPPPLPGTVESTKKVEPAPPAQPDPNAIRKAVRVTKAAGAEKGTGESEAAAAPSAEKQAPATPPPPPAATQQASAKDPSVLESAKSPIGELTAGSTEDSAETKREAVDLIQSSRKGVQGIKRALSSDETKTLAQINRFLDQAQKALDNGDSDGAYTLATKAKVLLDELTGGS